MVDESSIVDMPEEEQHGHFHKFHALVAPQILDVGQVDLIKEALVYQLVADKLHVFVCGNPGCSAKSSLPELVDDFFDYAYYSFTQRTSEVGLAEKAIRLREGMLHLDEIGFAGTDEDVGMLYDMMQHQNVTMDLNDQHGEFETNVNIYATSNPKGKKWTDYGNPHSMTDEIPISDAMFRRFHVAIFTSPYTAEEFDKVNRHKAKYENMDKEDWVDEALQEWMGKRIREMRMMDVDVQPPDKVFKWAEKLKGDMERNIVSPVTNEIMSGVMEIAKANARLRMASETNEQDWLRTVNFIGRTLATGGLDTDMIRERMKRVNN